MLIYEDGPRTMKFLDQSLHGDTLRGVELRLVNVGAKDAILHVPETQCSDAVSVFSRCSGSFRSRGHEHAPIMFEAMLKAAEQDPRCRVYNGTNAHHLEMNKLLANIVIASMDFYELCRPHWASLSHSVPHGELPLRVPQTKAISSVTPLQVRKVASALSPAGVVYLKGIVGGSSTTVHRLDLLSSDADDYIQRLAAQFERTDGVVMLQAPSPSAEVGMQYRVELVAGRVLYVVRIEMHGDTGVRNLCLCDIDESDSSVSLQILQHPGAMALEKGFDDMPQRWGNRNARASHLWRCCEIFAASQQLHVVALEGTLHRGTFYCFDVNTNSNYNSLLELKHGAPSGAKRVLQTMFP